jgi:hypothetical protein
MTSDAIMATTVGPMRGRAKEDFVFTIVSSRTRQAGSRAPDAAGGDFGPRSVLSSLGGL